MQNEDYEEKLDQLKNELDNKKEELKEAYRIVEQELETNVMMFDRAVTEQQSVRDMYEGRIDRLRAELQKSKEEHKKTVSDFEERLQREIQTKELLNSVILDLRQKIPTYLGERATFESRVQDLAGSLMKANVTFETTKQEKLHFSITATKTVKMLAKILDDTTGQMHAQLSSRKKNHEQVSILERGLEMEIISGKVKKGCDETKKMNQMEVEKNQKLEVKNEEMESTHKKNIADLNAEWEERIALLPKVNTAVSKHLEEERAAVARIVQASLESKKSNKQEMSKSMDVLKAAESKAGDLSKESTDLRQITSPISEGSMKPSSDASQTPNQKQIMNSSPGERSSRHSQRKQNKEGRGRELHSNDECIDAVERIEKSSCRKMKGFRRKKSCKKSQNTREERQAKHEASTPSLSTNSLPFHLRN